MRLRSFVAVATGRLAGAASRALSRGGGTALPGLLAEALWPGLTSELARQLPQGCALVTGTNGKTTTSHLLASVLRASGLEPLHNRAGSNLIRGLATTLLAHTSLRGELRVSANSIGLFEVDEAVLPLASKVLPPRVLAINNLFRDQLDRYGEVDSVAVAWRSALAALPAGTAVALNADDPLVAGLGEGLPQPVWYFGIEDTRCGQGRLDHAADSKVCPTCQLDYAYSHVFYGHMGHYRCPRCGRSRPQPQVAARSLGLADLSSTTVELATPAGSAQVDLHLVGLYNVYNALAATTIALALGLPLQTIVQGLQTSGAAFGRQEAFDLEGRRCHLLLVKNPVGCNEVLRTIFSQPGSKNLLLVLNDQIADGRDVSWIWDIDFGPAAGRCNFMVSSGIRAEDMALRLKYAGVFPGSPLGNGTSEGADGLLVEPDPERALRLALERTPHGGDLFVLPTYTAMLHVRELAARWAGKAPYWEVAETAPK